MSPLCSLLSLWWRFSSQHIHIMTCITLVWDADYCYRHGGVPQHMRMGLRRILVAFVSALKFQVAWACFTRLLIPDWCCAGKQPWATACQTSDCRSPGATVPQTSVELDPLGPEATYANITLMLLKWLYTRTQRYKLAGLLVWLQGDAHMHIRCYLVLNSDANCTVHVTFIKEKDK